MIKPSFSPSPLLLPLHLLSFSSLTASSLSLKTEKKKKANFGVSSFVLCAFTAVILLFSSFISRLSHHAGPDNGEGVSTTFFTTTVNSLLVSRSLWHARTGSLKKSGRNRWMSFVLERRTIRTQSDFYGRRERYSSAKLANLMPPSLQ